MIIGVSSQWKSVSLWTLIVTQTPVNLMLALSTVLQCGTHVEAIWGEEFAKCLTYDSKSYERSATEM